MVRLSRADGAFRTFVVQLFGAVLLTRFQLSSGVLRIQVRVGVLRVPA